MISRQSLKNALDWFCDFWIEILQGVMAAVIVLSTTVMSDEGFSTAYRNIVFDYSSDADAKKLFEFRKATVQNYCFRLLIGAGLIQVGLAILSWRHSKRVSFLENEILRVTAENEILVENIQNLLEGYLLNFAVFRLSFGDNHTNSERITLYAHDGQANCFVPAGRYSQNPEFKPIGRDRYPANEGCIGKAWTDGQDCLRIEPCPTRARKGYISVQGQRGIDESTASGFKMKSRFYYACRIDSPQNAPVAVLVIESTEPDRFTEEAIREVIEEEVRRNLSELVTRLLPSLPLPGDASRRGF